MKEWMSSDLSSVDLLVIQIDGIHMDGDLILVAAVGVDAKGDKHPLGPAEGATENAATVQALIDNLVERGLDPTVHSDVALVAAQAVASFDHADASLVSGAPLLAVAGTSAFLLAFAFGALVQRLGMQTRLTPFALAAASFLAE